MGRFRATCAAGAMALMVALPVRAEGPVVFDLSISGLPAATLSFTGSDAGGRYSVTGRLEASGLVALVRRVRYDAEARGAVKGKRFTPTRYSESTDTGRRRSDAVMEYKRGVPQVKQYSPPRDEGGTVIDPSTQGGTVDPLTAMYASLRDSPAGSACDLTLTLFDGQRRSQIRLGAPKSRDGGQVCAGEYRRLEGFSADDMAERTRFPFTLLLEPVGNGMVQVTEVRMETIYGRAVMARR